MRRTKTVIEVPPGTGLPLRVRLEGSEFPFWQWLEVPPGREVAVIACAEAVVTYLCHYLGGNYVPCGRNWGLDCSQHEDGSSVRTVYQGSLAVTRPQGGRVYLVNPTAACLRSGEPPLESRTDLLGRKLVFGRRLGGRNAKMYCHPTEEVKREMQGKGFSAGEVWRVQLNVWGVELRSTENWRALLESEGREPPASEERNRSLGRPAPAAEE